MQPFPEQLAYHGRVSSASTGRFAVLRLPLLAPAEKLMSLEGAAWTSTSISSSKSDMVRVGQQQLLIECLSVVNVCVTCSFGSR